jgi:hypothetical protein
MAILCLASINSALAHPCQPSPNNIEVHLHFKLEISCHILLQTASYCVYESQRSSCLHVQTFRCFLYMNLIASFYFPMLPEINISFSLSGSRYLRKSCHHWRVKSLHIHTGLSPSMQDSNTTFRSPDGLSELHTDQNPEGLLRHIIKRMKELG